MVVYKKQVTAAIIRQNGKILIAQRARDDELPFMWEFPGGKLEDGETLEECIMREIREELELDIKVLGVYHRIIYHLNGQEIPITFFNAAISGGQMRLHVHEEVRWIFAGEIADYEFMPPDIEVAGQLLKEAKLSFGCNGAADRI